MGYFVSKPVPWGERMPIEDAKEHIFGFVLLNDWSARDHQLFEMRPLVGSDLFLIMSLSCTLTIYVGPFPFQRFRHKHKQLDRPLRSSRALRLRSKYHPRPETFPPPNLANTQQRRSRHQTEDHSGTKRQNPPSQLQQFEIHVLDSLPAAHPPRRQRLWYADW
jgi:hypothetical protein